MRQDFEKSRQSSVRSALSRTALEELTYALRRGEPIIAVTGPLGTAKAMLSQVVAERRGPRWLVATIANPPRESNELLREILNAFGVLPANAGAAVRESHYVLVRTLEQFLSSLTATGVAATVVIEDAHLLSTDMFEQIRLLSNIGDDGRYALQVVLVGGPELDVRLSRDELRQLSQRISRRVRLEPLQPTGEVSEVGPRLSAARVDAQTLGVPQFAKSAARLVAPRAAQRRRITLGAMVLLALSVGLMQPARDTLSMWMLGSASSSDSISDARFASRSTAPVPPATPMPPASEVAKTGQVLPVSTPNERFLVVVASFRTRERATRIATDLRALGLPAFVRNASEWDQVVVGPYASGEEAAAAQARLVAAHVGNPVVTNNEFRSPTVRQRPASRAPSVDDTSLDEILQHASDLVQQHDVRKLQRIRDQVAERLSAGNSTADPEALRQALGRLDNDLREAQQRQLETDRRRFGAGR